MISGQRSAIDGGVDTDHGRTAVGTTASYTIAIPEEDSYVYGSPKVTVNIKRDYTWLNIGTGYYTSVSYTHLAAFNEAFTLHCHFISESTKVYVKEYFNSFKKQ